MFVDKIRRILVLALTLALAAGLITHGLGRPDMGARPAMIMAGDMAKSTKSEMPMSGKCVACGDGVCSARATQKRRRRLPVAARIASALHSDVCTGRL